MASWPTLTELKQKLGVDSTDWDAHLTRVLEAAIEQVETDVGEPVDTPTSSQAAAALVLAVSVGSTEGEQDVTAAARLPKYQRLMKGSRMRFGIA